MTTSCLKFSTTTRGKPLLIYDGYMYTLNRDRIYVKYWRCQERSCSATAHTDKNDNLKFSSGNHNHLSTPESIELTQLKHNIKCRVLVTCQLQACLENLATRFTKKQITLGKYIEGLSLLVAKKK